MSAPPEAFVVNSTAGNSAPFGGRRRSGKKMRLVKKKTVRRMLKKMGLRMRGGATNSSVGVELPKASADAAGDIADGATGTPVSKMPMSGGRSRKRTRRGRSKRGIFGLKY